VLLPIPIPGPLPFGAGEKLYLWKAVLNSQPSSAKKGFPGRVEAIEKGRGVVVSTGEGRLLVTRMQYEGSEEMAADECAAQYGIQVGAVLGE